MPIRNIDRLQDSWHQAGRYGRGHQMDERTQALVAAMFPPITEQPVATATDELSDLGADIGTKILEAVGDQALTREDIANRLGVSVEIIRPALAAVAADGHLLRSHSAPGRVSRYWKPRAADAA